MRTINNSSVFYAPGPVPSDPKELPAYIERNNRAIEMAINLLAAGHLDETHVAPVKPRNGDIRYFDGTSYDPGSGRGVYVYKVSSWVLLG